jgi:hypothetical protein
MLERGGDVVFSTRGETQAQILFHSTPTARFISHFFKRPQRITTTAVTALSQVLLRVLESIYEKSRPQRSLSDCSTCLQCAVRSRLV